MLIPFTPFDGPAFEIEAILIQHPQEDSILQEREDNASWRMYFTLEDLCEIGQMTRYPSNQDRVTVDGTVFLPGIVNVPSNGMVQVFLMVPNPGE
jgi:hypothetical protein